MFSLIGFAIVPSIFSGTQPRQWQGVGHHLGADKSISTKRHSLRPTLPYVKISK